MKKTKFLISIITVLSIALLTFPAVAASARASDQISMYRMYVSTSKGSIDVEFSITGTGTMNKIGCQSVYVYKHEGDSWRYVQRLLEDDEGMSKSNTFTHKNMVCCTGEAGVEYKVVVTVFAEDDAGRDARTKTFYVTGE